MSLETALDLARADQTVPPETIAGLVAQLRAVFDQLPASKQEGLLSGGWHQIRSPDWLPIVQRCYAGSPSPRLTGLALKRWHELDPQGARPFVLQEIARPKPRFGAREIGFLPDKTIPEVDEALAANFASEENRDSSGNLETLIARYATGTILPQVFETLDTLVGNSHCASPMAILAYALRVSPETARPRIERAIAARREGSSACHPSLFQEISRLHFDPFLEELAFAALSDPDPRLATGAAETLGKFGSSRAEAVLWQHYEQWASRWSGREAELDLAWFEENEERTAQLMLGRALFEALVNGQAWLTDRSKLERLRAHTRTRELRDALNGRFRVWNGERIRISLQPTMEQFYATVAFYSFDSFEKLKEKLLQFPSGTQFSLVVHARDRAIADPFVAELNGFLLSRGMSVREEGPAD